MIDDEVQHYIFEQIVRTRYNLYHKGKVFSYRIFDNIQNEVVTTSEGVVEH